jgi:hypothetical protein
MQMVHILPLGLLGLKTLMKTTTNLSEDRRIKQLAVQQTFCVHKFIIIPTDNSDSTDGFFFVENSSSVSCVNLFCMFSLNAEVSGTQNILPI